MIRVASKFARKIANRQKSIFQLYSDPHKNDALYSDKRHITNSITSSSNGKVKVAKSLRTKKKRDQLGLVVLEGYRHIYDALESGLRPITILLTSDAYESSQGITIETMANKRSILLEIVEDSVFKKELSDTVTSQGMVATFEKPAKDTGISIDYSRTKSSLLMVVMDQLADPGNVGTIIRSCYGLGVDAVINIEGGCDYWNPKVLRSAMGLCLQTKTMPMVERGWAGAHQGIYDAYQDYRQHYLSEEQSDSTADIPRLQLLIADGSADSVPHNNVDYSRPTVLVLGNEAWGVSDSATAIEPYQQEVMDVRRIKIEMSRNLESFNAAVAGAIILAEAARQREIKKIVDLSRAEL